MNGLAIDETSGLELDLYFDEVVNLERLSHPVSGKEYLEIHYPRKQVQRLQRWLAVQIMKFHTDPEAFRNFTKHWRAFLIFGLLIIVLGLGISFVYVQIVVSGEYVIIVAIGTTLMGLMSIISFVFRQFIPLVPHTVQQTLIGYDGHNIDNLVVPKSSEWLNNVIYDDAWPEYNQRATEQKNNQGTHLKKVELSKKDMLHLGVGPSVETFLRKYVDDDYFDTISHQQTTKVQRALIVIWTFNPPQKTSISGKLNKKFHVFSKRTLAQNIYDYLSKLEDDRMSPSTKDQFVSNYGPNGTFDENKADELVDCLKKVYHDAGPPLRKLLQQLEE